MEMMPVFTYSTTCIVVQDQTQVGEARRAAARLSRNLQMSDSTAGSVSVIVTELGNNIVNHGSGGQILFNPVWQVDGGWLDIIALDQGKGMDNLALCLEDGYSTTGTPGTGLGAVQRMASSFDIVSFPGSGTAILARVYNKENQSTAPRIEIAGINVPKMGEQISGDAWAARYLADQTLIMVADGLGHGISAAEASTKAVRTFANETDFAPDNIMNGLHSALRATRGAAVAVASLDHRTEMVNYCGVGNISGALLHNENRTKSMISQNGIIGHEMKRLQPFAYPGTESELLVMHSDGLQSQWMLKKYPGIFRRSAALIAAILYRDFTRGTDDVSIVVAKK